MRTRSNPCRDRCEFSIRLLLYFGPISDALRASSDTLMSLIKSGDSSAPVAIIAGSISFFSAINLTGKTLFTNIDEVYGLAKGKRPPNWPILFSPCQAYTAFAASVIPASLFTCNYAVQTYYFLAALPDEYKFLEQIAYFFSSNNKELSSILRFAWNGGAILAAGGSGFATALGDGHSAHRFFRNRFAGTEYNYDNKVAFGISCSLAGPLHALNSMQVSATFYAVVKDVFGINSFAAKCGLGVASSATGLCSFFFTGFVGINALYQFIDCLMDPQKRQFTTQMISAFLLSIGASSFLAFNQVALDNVFYNEVATDADLQSELIESIITSLCYTMILQNILIGTDSLYSSMHNCLSALINAASIAFWKVAARCKPRWLWSNNNSYRDNESQLMWSRRIPLNDEVNNEVNDEENGENEEIEEYEEDEDVINVRWRRPTKPRRCVIS